MKRWEQILLKWDREHDGRVVSKAIAAKVMGMILDGRQLWSLSEYERDTVQAMRNRPIEHAPLIVRMRTEAVHDAAIEATLDKNRKVRRCNGSNH